MAMKLVVKPTQEPITLEEMKAYLRIDDSEFDDVIPPLIQAAVEHCEIYQNRAYITQTWEITFDHFPQSYIKIPKPPLQEVVGITFIDKDGNQIAWGHENFIVDNYSEPGRIVLAHGKTWPSVTLQPINGVRIQFVAGYGDPTDIPERVKQAIKIFVAHRFEFPESEDVPAVVYSLLRPTRISPL
ncbi:head-tail connector protein [Brevibacillus laterosporus]|uniref:head-tail connector protein n=1 Tax=Brevibacillus laterosporus TaxID=1465 RepID=UPI0035A5D515